MKTYHPEKNLVDQYVKMKKLYNLSFSQSLETYWVWNEKAEMVRQVIIKMLTNFV